MRLGCIGLGCIGLLAACSERLPPFTGASPNPPITGIHWQSASAAPVGVTEAQAEVVAGKLYLFGGYTSWSPGPYLSSLAMHVYNPHNDTWERRASLPEGVTHGATAADERNIYLVGGYINPNTGQPEDETLGSRRVYRYDTEEDHWYTDLPELPVARGAGAMVRRNRTLHYFGGTAFDRKDSGHHWTLSLDSQAGWEPRQPLPNPRNHLAAALLDDKIYAIGGQHSHHEQARHHPSVHIYDPAKDRWTKGASLPLPLSHHTATTLVIDGQIVTMGGERAYRERLANVFVYDPLTDRWAELEELPEIRGAGAAGVIDGEIIFTTGYYHPDYYQRGQTRFKETTFRGQLLR